jgi:transcriptional regulator with XRE-family HTH domain
VAIRTEGIGGKIRELRGEMTQVALAAAAGMDQSALSRIESGERSVQLDELVALAAPLGVEPGALLSSDEEVFAFRAADGSEVQDAFKACSKIIDDLLVFNALVGTR